MSVLLEPPTAQTSLAETAEIPLRNDWFCGDGLGTRFHAVPFQCSIRVLFPVSPAAQALRGEIAVTAARRAKPLPTAGLATRRHLVPLKCRISALRPEKPTAQTSRADVAATPLSQPAAGRTETRCQTVPFQCSTSVRGLPSGPECPTAHAFVAVMATTSSRTPVPARTAPGAALAALASAGAAGTATTTAAISSGPAEPSTRWTARRARILVTLL